MPFEAGQVITIDTHNHHIGRGGTHSVHEAIDLYAKLNFSGVGFSTYHELQAWVYNLAKREARQKGMLALPVSEISTLNGHVKLIPRPLSAARLRSFSKEIPHYSNEKTPLIELADRMWGEYQAIMEFVHVAPIKPFSLMARGYGLDRIVEAIVDLRAKGIDMPIGVETKSGELDFLSAPWNEERLEVLSQKVAELKDYRVGATAGSDDHGRTIGLYRTSWQTKTPIDSELEIFDSYAQALREGRTESLGPDHLPAGFRWFNHAILTTVNHGIPRIENHLYKFPGRQVMRQIDLLQIFFYLSRQTTPEARAWLKEFHRNKNGIFQPFEYEQVETMTPLASKVMVP